MRTLAVRTAPQQAERQPDQADHVTPAGPRHSGLRRDLSRVVQRKDAGSNTPPDLTIQEKDVVTPEREKQAEQLTKKGVPPAEAVSQVMDDAFAERVTKAGGKRVQPATPGRPGSKILLQLQLQLQDRIEIEGKVGGPGLVVAAIDDDDMYNCHSFTFFGAKQSKLADLRKLTHKAPPDTPVAGQGYVDASEIMRAGIQFFFGPPTLVAPRWVGEAEARAALASYQRLSAADSVKVADIAVYEDGSGGLPHSGVVVAVDGQGRPTRLRSKWGRYSLFEHPPTAVPACRVSLSDESPPESIPPHSLTAGLGAIFAVPIPYRS
jgi:uncharacterized protein YodC (DUF2158 family)